MHPGYTFPELVYVSQSNVKSTYVFSSEPKQKRGKLSEVHFFVQVQQ